MFKRIFGIGVLGFLAAAAACNTSDASGDCTTLTSCCSQLTDASNKELCTELVGQGDATSCGEAQSDFEGDGPARRGDHERLVRQRLRRPRHLLQLARRGGPAPLPGRRRRRGRSDVRGGAVELPDRRDVRGLRVDPIPSGGSGCSGLSSCCSLLPSEEQAGCNDSSRRGTTPRARRS